MSDNTQNQQAVPPVKIAFVIDNQVVDILHTDERLAAIFLSEPTIVDVTGDDGRAACAIGDIYDPASGTFTSSSDN